MRNVLALLIVGTSVAVAGGASFAGEPGKDSVDRVYPPAAVSRAEATNTGTIAGPSTPRCVWCEMRDDNYDSGRKN